MAENQKPLQAEYVRTERENIFGEPEVIRIRDISNGKTKGVTVEQLSEAIQKGLIEVKYIKVRPDGTIKVTKNMKRKPQPKNENQKKLIEFDKKIKRFDKKIEALEKQYKENHDKETYDALSKVKGQKKSFSEQPEYMETYEKWQAKKDRGKKIK